MSPEIPFRVREIGEPYLAVHIPESHRASLSDSLIRKIEHAGSLEAASGKALKIVFLPVLSGYFDHLSVLIKRANGKFPSLNLPRVDYREYVLRPLPHS